MNWLTHKTRPRVVPSLKAKHLWDKKPNKSLHPAGYHALPNIKMFGLMRRRGEHLQLRNLIWRAQPGASSHLAIKLQRGKDGIQGFLPSFIVGLPCAVTGTGQV